MSIETLSHTRKSLKFVSVQNIQEHIQSNGYKSKQKTKNKKQPLVLLLGSIKSLFRHSQWNMPKILHSHTKMPVLHYKVLLPFLLFSRDGNKRYRCYEEERSCNAWSTLIRIWISSQGFLRGASGKESSVLWQPRGDGVQRGVEGRFMKEGKYVYLWLIYADVWQNPAQYCKAIILQLKMNKFLKYIKKQKKKKKKESFC